jgi:hypothetical protein
MTLIILKVQRLSWDCLTSSDHHLSAVAREFYALFVLLRNFYKSYLLDSVVIIEQLYVNMMTI